jgi:hypothetical protein
MKSIVATKPTEHDVLDFLHDRFYEPGKIVYDPAAREVRIETTVLADGRQKSGKHPVVKATLRVIGAKAYEVIDNAHVGEADFGSFSFEDGQVVITGSLPVKVLVRADSFHLRLDVTDDVVSSVGALRRNFLRS